MAPDPRIIYKQHLAARRAEIAHREQRHRILGHGKLAMAAFALVLVWMALAQGAFSILWVLIPIAGFTLLVVVHEKLLKELERRRRAARFFEKALARLDGNWAGTGEPGDRYNEASHPYALDLDLFGKGSLFELLCTARTRIGEDRLAQWLKSPAAPEVVRARHAAVEELARPRGSARGTRRRRRGSALRRGPGTPGALGRGAGGSAPILPSACGFACILCSAWPVLRPSGFTWCGRQT